MNETSSHLLPEETEGKPQKKKHFLISSVPARIQTEHLSNTSEEICHYSPLGKFVTHDLP
jgi:hypothetical protein